MSCFVVRSIRCSVKIKGVRVEPSDLNLQKFKCRVTSELTKLQTLKPSTRAKRIQKLRLSVSSWMANFKLCDGIDDFKSDWLGKIKWAEMVTCAQVISA